MDFVEYFNKTDFNWELKSKAFNLFTFYFVQIIIVILIYIINNITESKWKEFFWKLYKILRENRWVKTNFDLFNFILVQPQLTNINYKAKIASTINS